MQDILIKSGSDDRPPWQWVSGQGRKQARLRESSPTRCRSVVRSIVLLEIVSDDLGVLWIDGSTEGGNHFGNLGIPSGGVQERRVHRNVIKTVTGAAICLDFV